MKKSIYSLLAALLITGTQAFAQEKTTATQDLKNAGKKIGNKTASIASKGASKIADQQLKDKVGPNGEAVYINGKRRYYWIDGKGRHRYITEKQLKNKY
jgi:protein involved in temperature-dependent protein secretion